MKEINWRAIVMILIGVGPAKTRIRLYQGNSGWQRSRGFYASKKYGDDPSHGLKQPKAA
jgi:hypothetical protein